MPHLRKPMRDLYRECNPFSPEPLSLREQLQDAAGLIVVAVVLVATALVSLAILPTEMIV
jgi:hypothetical protein